jgi:hypothetical protein
MDQRPIHHATGRALILLLTASCLAWAILAAAALELARVAIKY